MIKNILKMIKTERIPTALGVELLKRLRHADGDWDPETLPEAFGPEGRVDVTTTSSGSDHQAIAVIGMAGRFPDAENLDTFWKNLADGRDSVREVPADRWNPSAGEPETKVRRRGGFLSDIDKFDPLFFSISPKEAELMDPQQRLFLQAAWHALEDAGCAPGNIDGKKCGVFVGYNFVDYSQRLAEKKIVSEAYSYTGNASPILPARISYLMNLKGPSIAINTACSSSLVAVHLACESIRSGTSHLALAGGAQVMTTGEFHILADSLGMSAVDGKCKTFDHRADGFVPGEAVGVVLLKSLAEARRDGDHIHGIIKGSEINQDGRTNGITAPSAPSQTALECDVYDKFDIHPETIGYVETHGTGTELGDPIEIQALTDAFGRYTNKGRYCAVGAVKTNIGHTLAAAGISSLIKVLLCLRYQKLVPSLHFEKANPHIDFENSPFYVNTEYTDWPVAPGMARRAAVSAFGFSGTNAHVVVEEYQEPEVRGERSGVRGQESVKGERQLIVLSARNEDRLKAYAAKMVEFIEHQKSKIRHKNGEQVENRKSKIENIAYTLQTGREAMEERLAVVVSDLKNLKDKLAQYLEGETDLSGLYVGNTKRDGEKTEQLLEGEVGETYLGAVLEKRDFGKIARLWVMGGDIDWLRLYPGEKPRRCSLPTYPFAKERYWVPEPEGSESDNSVQAEKRSLSMEVEGNSECTMFAGKWEPEDPDERLSSSGTDGSVLLFDSERNQGSEFQKRLNADVVTVLAGKTYSIIDDRAYEIDPAEPEDYIRLLENLKAANRMPTTWIHAWALDDGTKPADQIDDFALDDNRDRYRTILSLYYFLKALSTLKVETVTRILFVFGSRTETINPSMGAVFGYARSLGFLLPKLSFKSVQAVSGTDHTDIVDSVCREIDTARPGECAEIRFADNRRYRRRFVPLVSAPAGESKIKTNGVYLITGGAGGLGLLFARYLVERYRADLVLTGRSPMDESIQRRIDTLSASGSKVLYLSADVSNAEAMSGVMKDIRDRFGGLNGVIHTAGVAATEIIFRKTEKEFESTLSPKIDGTIVLDYVTREEPLDFFVLFSSTSAVIGDFGQCDYAVANRFMDRFAEVREKARREGSRSGRSIAVNWPLWRQGGMHQPSDNEAFYLQASGMRYLETGEGLAAFERILVGEDSQVVVMAGDPVRMLRALNAPNEHTGNTQSDASVTETIRKTPVSPRDVRDVLEADIVRMVSSLLKIDPDKLGVEESFGNFGFDSISLKRLGDRLGDRFKIELSPAVFFANSSIRRLARFLVKTHGSEIKTLYVSTALKNRIPEKTVEPAVHAETPMVAEAAAVEKGSDRFAPVSPPISKSIREADIAIVGMHGVFPGSKDLNRFWRHLEAGNDLITSVPEGRWRWEDYLKGSDPAENRFPQWAGYISDVDKFDPLFFKISPREAEMMDPQHRLFLETVWKTLEDGGFKPSSLSGRPIGVYAGIQFNDYEHLLMFSRQSNPQSATGTAAAMLANRVSFLMNWHGPSESIVTACSSSLIAVHHAVTSLRSGESEMAIAGGVSLILYPGQLIGAHKLGVLSPEGRCKTFDESADGYVKGEGVGAVLLKPLKKAVSDRDHIHAVIKGTATNHGGAAASLTAPNSDAQAELLTAAFDNAAIDPETITYLELHGTGTELGDPVEVEGIKKAFTDWADRRNRPISKRHFCGIGSVKTHIGHLEPAAGIAGLITVILSMQHQTLPHTLHLNALNPYIHIEDSPFYIVEKIRPWKRLEDDMGNRIPLRAGVSSFGFGGANAHVVVEEYQEKEFRVQDSAFGPEELRPRGGFRDKRSELKAESSKLKGEPQIIVLSARNEERLKAYAQAMVDYIAGMDKQEIRNPKSEIRNIAYTLQTGREAMAERMALVVADFAELRERLTLFIEKIDDPKPVFNGRVDTRSAALQQKGISGGGEKASTPAELPDWETMAKRWVSGYEPDWKALYPGKNSRRIPLPTYPFARKRYWIPETKSIDPAFAETLSTHGTEMPSGPLKTLFFRPKWRKSVPSSGHITAPEPTKLIIFSDQDSDLQKLKDRIKRETGFFNQAVLVRPGKTFKKENPFTYTVNIEDAGDYRKLLTRLNLKNSEPLSIVYLWSSDRVKSDNALIEAQINRKLFSVFFMCQAVMERKYAGKTRLVSFSLKPPKGSLPFQTALAGLFKTLQLEHPGFQCKTVESEDSSEPAELIEAELSRLGGFDVRYRHGDRWTRQIEETTELPIPEFSVPLKENGVYLLTGGSGGLGMLLAKHLARRVAARLVLVGRSEQSRKLSESLGELKDLGAEAVYIAADVSRRKDVDALIAEVRSRFGVINGVIHLAGVIRDAFILRKTRQEIVAVTAPKVFGTIHMDAATKYEPLDFFALFSSTASILGNAGQSDYAFANGFMDGFARWRENLRKEGKRFGKTVSINWPLWKNGGMEITGEQSHRLFEATGLKPLPQTEGTEAFEQILLGIDQAQCMATYGNPEKIRDYLFHSYETVAADTPAPLPDKDDASRRFLPSALLLEKTAQYLKNVIADVLKLEARKIDIRVNLEEYGIDSLLINRFNDRIEQVLGPIPKTLLFEYQTVEELSRYMAETYAKPLSALFATSDTGLPSDRNPNRFVYSESSPSLRREVPRILRSDAPAGDTPYDGIAVIGMAGRYPLAEDMDAYWANLKDGRDGISEIPMERWDYRDYFDPDPEMADQGKIYCKWGGFLADVDKFDALFFNISPRDAELMDPQERLFLETAWHTMEDAGYNRSRWHRHKTGVFVGVTTNSYHLWGPDIWRRGGRSIPTSLPWSIANRVSYCFDFKGPSLPVDTACSASLSAVHIACESLRKNECNMALAGGVNLYLHPSKYVQMCQTRMLSLKGRCHTFGLGGDGFVPGEGVGAVLLKPLHTAVSDGDHIYGVIRASGINHGGKTTGYTVPNPRAQAALILEALEKAGIDPGTIGYVEAHGTGTELGDPVEIRGLTQAFRKYTEDKQYCAIGSVKSNIGHLESAAGIAGLSKILLQLKHRQLVPSLNCSQPNPKIDFKDSPFFVQQELSEWQPAASPSSENGRQGTRIAAISSFGAGGANAHLILEEFQESEFRVQSSELRVEPQLIVLSAKNEDRLREYAKRMVKFLEIENRKPATQTAGKSKIENMAYTLQTGREAMDARLAVIASDPGELKEKLDRYIHAGVDADAVYFGRKRAESEKTGSLLAGETGQAFLDMITEKRELDKLAQLWVSGGDLDWEKFHSEPKPTRLSLPVYPFSRSRYWLPEASDTESALESATRLHPMVERNRSTFDVIQFAARFSGRESYVNGITVGGKPIFPFAAYLEMARAAGSMAGKKNVHRLFNIRWAEPGSGPDSSAEIRISLHPIKTGVGFQVSASGDDADKTILSRGEMAFETAADRPEEAIDLDAVRKRCAKTLSADDCYRMLDKSGFQYGSGFKTLQEFYFNETEALSQLELPVSHRKQSKDFLLHPALLEGVFQSIIGLLPDHPVSLPCELTELRIFEALNGPCYAHIEPSRAETAEPATTFDIQLTDPTGRILSILRGFTVRGLTPPTQEPVSIYFHDQWTACDIGNRDRTVNSPVLLFEPEAYLRPGLQKQLGVDIISVQPGDRFREIDGTTYSVNPESEADYRHLLSDLQKQNRLPYSVVHFWSQDTAVSSDRRLRDQIDNSLFSFFNLSKALMDCKPTRPIQMLFAALESPDGPQPQYAAMGGFAKTLGLENPMFACKTVSISGSDATAAVAAVARELQSVEGVEIRYQDKKRSVRQWVEFNPVAPTDPRSLLKDGGRYLITGGAGGLGLIFTDYFTRQVDAQFVLTGRSPLTDEKSDRIQTLNGRGSNVVYLQADMAEASDVKSLLEQIRTRFGGIDGIIHAAGVVRDSFVLKKTTKEMLPVLGPKVFGTVYLDEATADERLDFFVLFSSTSAVMGNAGQSDYAYANAFMDHFAARREKMRTQGKRYGKTLSINWPLWRHGGMQVNPETIAFFAEKSGWVPLPTEAGEAAWGDLILQSAHANGMVCYGYREPLLTAVTNGKDVRRSKGGYGSVGDAVRLTEKTEAFLKQVLAGILKLPEDQLDSRMNLEEFGIDSLKVNAFNRIMEERVGPLPKTLLFENQTLFDLTRYLVDSYGLVFEGYLGLSDNRLPVELPVSTAGWEALKPFTRTKGIEKFGNTVGGTDEDIAIIGVSGRYPGARNVNELWKNLYQGKDCITEIPLQRWDYRNYYDPDPEMSRHGRIYCKWGGFLEDADRFDPMFFKISPREAEKIDPQERIFLETAWLTFEDAGYPRNRLKQEMGDGEKPRIGVYAGVTTNTYLMWGHETWSDENSDIPMTLPWSVANRVSYVLDLQGPSMPVDTACSSSLYAIHMACESLKKGECHMALAGGVNLYLHPAKFVQLCQARMLSATGRCHSFGDRGDGFVPGEGVGAFLLKPLSRAIADGDYIYAVIRGTSVNHGGKTTGYTVPNPNAQTALVLDALRKTGIDPESISYVEAHGTGTELGDPVEIRGLTQAFAQYTQKHQYCPIGSIKSNMGHLESAAGIAGLTKIILQMKHKALVPTLHCEPSNPNITFEETPFYLQREQAEWKRPVRGETVFPRRAAISSFGAGGANAHVIVEEYQEKEFRVQGSGFRDRRSELKAESSKLKGEPQIIVLSARNEDRLKDYANRLADFIEGIIKAPESSIENIAYTLQTGREPMEERLALVVTSLDELREQFTRFVATGGEAENSFRGNIRSDKRKTEILVDGEAGEAFIEKLVREKQHHKLAQLWVMGVELNWDVLHPIDSCHRIPLPGYPFAQNRYWIPERKKGHDQGRNVRGVVPSLHPFLERDRSTPREQCFSTTFTGDEFFLADHRIEGRPTLPAVAYLEMARAAGQFALETEVNEISNVSWERPIILSGNPMEVFISLFPEPKGIAFEIHSNNPSQEAVIHARGRVNRASEIGPEVRSVEVAALIQGYTDIRNREACYRAFEDSGLYYGPAFQAVETLYCKPTEAVARLMIPDRLLDRFHDFVLHPTIMDGALQTVSGLTGQFAGGTPYLPFVMGDLKWSAPLTEKCFVRVDLTGTSGKDSEIKTFDITVLSDTGQVLATMTDYSIKAAPDASGPRPGSDDEAIRLLGQLAEGKISINEIKEKIRL